MGRTRWCIFGDKKVRITGFINILRNLCSGYFISNSLSYDLNRTLPDNCLPQVAAQLKQLKIQGLLIIGGFEVSVP